MAFGSSVLLSGSFTPHARTKVATRRRGAVLIVVLALVAAVILGIGTAYAGIWMGLLGVGAFSVAFAFALPLDWLILLVLLLSTVVAGTAEYFLGLSQAHWIPYLLGLVLALRALIERGGRVGVAEWQSPQTAKPAFGIPAAIYLVILFGSSAINVAPVTQVITGAKNFLFMWGVMFAVVTFRDWERLSLLVWRLIVVVGCVQLPVTAYQRVFVASEANNHVPWDSVVGTFGGIPLLGGHSASMVLFICAGLAWVLLGWRDGTLSRPRVLLYLAFAIPSVLLAEVKAVVVWLLLVAALVFVRFARTRPLVFFGGTLLNALLVVAVVGAYVTFNYSNSRGSTSLSEMYEKQVSYLYDTQRFNPKTRELGRVSSVVFWAQQQKTSEPVSLLIGNGMGASRGLSTFGPGAVAKRYNFFIDTSALSVLLWDVGLLGTMAFSSMLLLGAVQGLRLGGDPRIAPGLRRLAEMSGIALSLVLSGLPYTKDAVDDSSIQFLLFVSLAGVAAVAGLARSGRAGANGATT